MAHHDISGKTNIIATVIARSTATKQPQRETQPHIVQHYYPILTRFARRIILNEPAAETLLPAVFSQLHTSLPDIHTKKQLHQFLITATRMACHAWLHQQALLLKANEKTSQ